MIEQIGSVNKYDKFEEKCIHLLHNAFCVD